MAPSKRVAAASSDNTLFREDFLSDDLQSTVSNVSPS